MMKLGGDSNVEKWIEKDLFSTVAALGWAIYASEQVQTFFLKRGYLTKYI